MNCFYCSSLSKLPMLLFLLYSFYYRFNVLYVNWGRNIEPRRATIRTFLFICFGIEKFSTRCWKVNRKVKTWNNFDPLILKFDLEKALWSWYITVASSEHIKKKKWGNNLSNYLFFSFLFSLKDYCFDVLDKDKPLLSNYCLLFSSKYIFQITHFDVKFQWNKIMKARMQIVKL